MKTRKLEGYDANHLNDVRLHLKFPDSVNFSILKEGSTIPAGTEYNLILFTSKNTNGMEARQKIFETIGFKMEYQSMYGEMFTSYSSNYDQLQ